MRMEYKTYTTNIVGTAITVEVGKLAEQANGACTVRCGDTLVFVAARPLRNPGKE